MLKQSLLSFLGQVTHTRRRNARRRRVSQTPLGTIQRLESRALLTDAAPYVVSINRTAETDLAFGGSVSFQATFSEAVSGVDAADFSVIRTGSTSYAALQVTSTDSRHYLVTVTEVKGSGFLALNLIDNGSIRDGSGQGLITPGSSPAFLNQQTLSVGTSPESIAAGDVNGDGNLDVVVSNSGVTPNGTLSVLLGNGNGTFQTQVTYTAGREPKSVTLSDLNGDGKLDVVLANLKDKTIGVMLNNGNGTFQTQQTYTTGRDPNAIALGDINGDAKTDVVIVNTKDDSITLLTGKGDGTFQSETTMAAGGSPVAVDVVDLNGDSKLDVVVLNSLENGISVLLGNGDSTFQSRQNYATGTQPVSVTHGDLNNDGKLDLVVANFSSNTVSVLKGNGDGTFQAQQTFATGTSPQTVVLSDLNGDGLLDLAVTNRGSNSLSTLVGKGDGTFQVQQTFATGTAPFAVTVGDVSGDGKRDLVATNRTSNTISVLVSSLAGSFDGQIYQIAEPVLHWQGDIDSKWSTPGNWLENAVPVNGTDLYFDTGTTGFAGNFSATNDIAGLTVGYLRVTDNATAGDFELAGAAIATTKGISIQGDVGFHMNLASVKLLASQQFEIASAVQSTWNSPIDLQTYELTWKGSSTLVAGSISGSGSMTFATGDFQLTAANAFTGATSVKANVVMTGSSLSPTTIESGGQLSGSGSIAAPVVVKDGGLVRTTNGQQTQSAILATGSVEARSGSTLQFPIGGSTAGNSATSHGQWNVTGTVTIAGFLEINRLNNFVPLSGQELILISNDGTDAVSGTFSGLPEGAMLYPFIGSANYATITYKGGDGNDVSLKVGPQVLNWRGDVDNKWSTPGNWLEDASPKRSVILNFGNQSSGNNQSVNDIEGLSADFYLNVSHKDHSDVFSVNGKAIQLTSGIWSILENGLFYFNLDGVTLSQPNSEIAFSTVFTEVFWNSPIDLQSNSLKFTHDAPHPLGRIEPSLKVDISGVISGSGGIDFYKDAVRLTAANTYTGATNVYNLLWIDGSTVSPTTVRDGGTLVGYGAINADVIVKTGGHLGTGILGGIPASILHTGNLDLQIGSWLDVPVNGDTAGNTSDNYGQVSVTGAVKLAGNLKPYSTFFTPTAGQELVIIANDGTDAVIGNFAGLPEGAVLYNFLGTGHNAKISYKGGDGNDVSLKVGPQVLHWEGDVSTYWSDPANWSENAAPLNGAELVFDTQYNVTGNFQPYNDMSGLVVSHITVNDNSAAGSFELSGNAIELQGRSGSAAGGGAIRSGIDLSADDFSMNLAGLKLQQSVRIGNYTGTYILWNTPVDLQSSDLVFDSNGEINGGISGTGRVYFQGFDVLLKAANTYTGLTDIRPGSGGGGNLELSGSTTSETLVDAGAFLSGSGTIAAPVTVTKDSFVILQSNATGKPSILTTGHFAAQAGSFLQIPIGGGTAGNDHGFHGQLNILGTVSLAGNLGMYIQPGFVPSDGQELILINNDGSDAISGAFSDLPEGTVLHNFLDTAHRATISYQGGDGNDVSLKVGPQVLHWRGSVDNKWSTPGNWLEGVAPVRGAELWFDTRTAGFAGNFSPQNDISNLQVSSLFVSDTWASQDFEISGLPIEMSKGIQVTGNNAFTMRLDAVTLTAPQSFLLNSSTTAWKSALVLQSALLIQGQNMEFSGAISGLGSVQVQTGKLVLSGTNTYTGSTKVVSQLVVNGSVTSPVEVLAGGTITGNGTASGGIAVSKGGIVSPGDPIGVLSAGNVSFAEKSSLSVEIRGTQPGNAVSGYDSLNVTGTVQVAGAMQVTLASGFVPAGGDSFNLVVNDGNDAIVGTFDGLPNGGHFSVGNITFQISYTGGDGNDLVLTTLYVTYTVSNTLSSGVGSFADAITQANNHPGRDQIVFQASGVISGALPAITDTVMILGSTAPGFSGSPVLQLKGDSAGSVDGLNFVAGSDNSVVYGLSITGFAESGIRINANGIKVTGNWIGIDPAGVAAGNKGFGIYVQSGTSIIGGNTAALRNVVSANLQSGILVQSDTLVGQTIQGNYIGTNVAGTSALGNGWDGISVVAGASRVLIGGGFSNEGNLISGNLGCGIVFDSAGTGSRVSGNRIGTDASGSVAIGNGFGRDATAGIVLQNMHNNSVTVGTNSDGTVDASEGNLVSGNFYDGIQILEFENAGSHIIAGNLIGVDAGGTGVLPNQRHGVRISSASNNRIGTDGNGASDAAEANVIAGNRNPDATDASQYASGILIEELTGQIPQDNLIAGNFIGTDRNGSASLGNQGNGITVLSAQGTVIGLSAGSAVSGSTASAGNVIRFNRGAGVRISGPVHAGNTAEQFTTLHANSFQANFGLAVDVAGAGPTLNSSADNALDFPILESAAVDNGTLVLTGFVTSGATIEFYLNAPRAGQVFGEGIQLVARLQEGSGGDLDSASGTYGPLVRGVSVSSAPITQNRFRFELPLPAGVDNGAQLTAMAVGSVSEFSPLILVGEQGSAVAPEVTLDVVPGQLPWTQLEGEQLQVSGSFYDPDSRSWTATVDYGDGDGPQQLALSTSKTFDLRHVYRTPGTYSVTVQVTDNGLATGSATLTVRVQNQIPQANFDDFDFQHTTNEGDSVILAGSFTDGGGAHTVLVEWGDSTTTTLQLASGVSSFSTTHLYRDDTNATGSVTASDIYSVRITIRDTSEATGLTSPDGLFLVDVSNVAPTLNEVRFNEQLLTSSNSLSLVEGDTLNLSGILTDPGISDQHTIRINWGDGDSSTVNLTAGNRTFQNLSGLSHTYLNDDEDGQYDVSVELWDDDEPLAVAMLKRTIRVANQAPRSVQVSAVPTSINEGGTLQISGTFVDAGVLDGHQVQVIWGDGTPNSVLNLAAGVTTFGGAALNHQYLNNPGAAVSYTVQVVITDLDNTAEEGSGSTTVTVVNVAPTVSALTVRRTDGTSAPLKEGDSIIVTGSFADVSPEDRHQVTISWGDNTQTTATVDAMLRTFSATHTYYDNYNPASIVATVVDGRYSGSTFVADGGSVTSNAVLKTIVNVAPEVTIAPVAGSTPTETKLTADVVDPGLDDTFTYLWEINSGFGYTAQGTQKILSFDSTVYMAPLIRLTVRDDDGGSDTFEVVAIFGTTADETITVTTDGYTRRDNSSGGPSDGGEFAAPIFGGLTWPHQILVLGFDGQDLLDASALPATHLAILDGGQKQDYLIGGAGADICYPNDGNDTVDGGAGDDRFVLTPNSILTVIDTSGYNTLDFSRSAFSDNTGITFDLTKIRSSGLPDANADAQIVSTVGATHIVAAFGTFQQLIGSNYGDSLTVSSGATVYGGGGKDTLFVGSNTASTTLSGGADDDVLVISGTNISNLNFGGDDGLDLLRNLGTVTNLTFGGGADDDILQNSGAILGTLVFGGDDGVDILTNTGDIAVLNFNGGADDDIFVNNGSAITALSFGGDSDILLNAPGTIGILNFAGDDGADIFANLGTITTLTFSGGADDDIFVNVGTQTTLNFGGDDDVLLGNIGTVGTIATLVFNGDDGSDLLRNLGTITSLTFSGGADDDVLLNLNTGLMNSLVFSGDDGSDLLRNDGVMTGLVFTGGADDDILQNISGAAITGLNFGGDDGSDLLTNTGTIIGLTFTGGADDDVLNNYGAISSTLVFSGDDGADLFRNAGTIVTLTFGGGADDDIFANLAGGQVETLTFGGDDGIDLFQNSGNVTTLSFGGGADEDILVNNVGATIGTLVFGGDRELTAAGQLSPILNAADDGADTLINFGSVGQLTFTGGADDDVLINRSGGTVTSLNFGGDDGIDTLQNAGVLTTLTFGGGADEDTLVNTGTIIGTLTFGGDQEFDIAGNLRSISANSDDGVDTLANYGTIGAIVFRGGADDDVLLNQTGAAIQGVLSFQGDSGNDVLRNDGTVTALTFGGGADDDLLINSGAVIETLNFSGDSGNDILYNTGSEVGSLIFSGGADDDLLLNTGSMLALLNFSGGADDDIFQNSGSNITALVFGGDSGNDVLRNTGNGIVSLTFGGGADDDVLISSGTGVSVIIFGGDIDPASGAIIAGTNAGRDLLIVEGSGNNNAASVIVFNGDDGADSFRYSATAFASITFNGGADDDVFQLNTDNAGLITFNGGADDDILQNNGSGVTDMVFHGDAGSDVLYNNGNQVAGLIFSGGSDDDTLVNTGSAISGLIFSGDSGNDIFVNAGNSLSGLTFNGGADDDVFSNRGSSLTLLIFNGDAGNDRFINQIAGIQARDITFNGDSGSDVLVNYAGGLSNLTFSGGADDDVFQNSGVNVSALVFNGGADDDVFVNQAAGAITGLNFGGDDGADTLLNSGAMTTLSFGGGADDDVLVNRGTVTTLIFGGDQEFSGGSLQAIPDASDDGADTLLNYGTVTTLQFSGGADDDVLVSNGTVGTLIFTGGADDDVLQNNGAVGLLQFAGGADDDVLMNNADGVTTIEFSGDDGTDSFVNKGSGISSLTFFGGADDDTLRIHGTNIGRVVFNGGADSGSDSFHYNAIGGAGSSVTFIAGSGNDYFAWRGAADSVLYQGGAGNDHAIILGSGSLTLDGGEGDDTIYFQSNPPAEVLVVETYGGLSDNSRDTLDFSAFNGNPLNLDLRQTTRQSQSSLFAITLSDSRGMENVIGTPFADVIYGNSRDNMITGAQYSAGFSGPVAGSRATTQWVLLDFDTATETGEHEYTTEERLAIAARVQQVYRGPNSSSPWFDVRVALNRGDIPVANGDFATISFNQTPAFGRPGGLASEVDPGNLNLGGTAVVQVNGLLGGVITAEDISNEGGDAGSDKGYAPTIGDEEIGASKPAATSENFILLSAKIAAHELGHLIGLRHQDSFGPIGFGLHDPPGSAAYKPNYAGPVAGVETFDHLMGSGASVGSDRFNDLNDLFFGEREAIKLGFAFSNTQDTVTDETSSSHSTAATAQSLILTTVEVPNTLSQGLNASKTLFVQMQSVEGQLKIYNSTQETENDWYKFSGTAGTVVNVEVYSNSLIRYGTGVDNYVDPIVRVWYDASGVLTLVPFYGGEAVNDDIFEPTDSAIVDLVLPQTGTYYIEVDTFQRDPSDPVFDPANPASPLNPDNPNNILAYPSLLQRFLDTRDNTDIGAYQLFISGFARASATDGIDTIRGYGGTDTIDGGSGDSFALSLDPGATGTANEGDEFSRMLTITDRAAISWSGSTVSYGDGSGEKSLTVDSAGSFTLAHTYTDDGIYTVTMVIQNDIGQTLTKTLQVNVSNVAPTILTLSGSSSVDERSTQTYAFTASDPGTDTFLVHSIAAGTQGTVSNVQLNSVTGAGTFDVTFSAGSGTTVLTILLKDSDGAISSSRTLTVTVNNVNDAPTNLALSASSIPENSLAQTTIGTLSSTDPDAGETFTYSLVSGTGSADNASFVISGSVLKSNAVFDYETKSSYSVRIRTTDVGGLWFEKALTITVTDVAEDVTPPVSLINALPAATNTSTITLTATGSDPGAGASGILDYDFYYSTGGSFIKIGTSPANAPSIVFAPAPNITYWFRTLARDNAGNRETKATSDTYTRVGDIVPPASQVTAATANSVGKFTVQMTGTKASGTILSVYDVYVILDGGTASLLGTTTATSIGSGKYTGSFTYQGKLDGLSHTYGFYSRAKDLSGNVEAAPSTSDVVVTTTFAAASLTATGIDVQNGANQRSYVRYLDILFSDNPTALLGSGRIAVERFDISATSITAGTGVAVTGFSTSQTANKLKLDFGMDGLGGKLLNGDGFYRVRLDLNGNGLFTDSSDTSFEFFRLFGDANGDGTVDIADTNLVTGQVGRSGANLDADIDGNGTVNATDRLYTIRQRGRKLLSWLLAFLDD